MPEAQISKTNQTNGEVSCKQPGLLKRILWVLISPGKLMECLAQKPRVLFGLILAAVSMDIFYYVRLPLFKDYTRNTLVATNAYMESLLGQSATAEMVEESLPSTIVQSFILTPVMMVVGLLFITLVYFAILKIMGGKGKFKAYLSVLSYSYVITAIYILITMLASFITGSLHIGTPLTSLAMLAPNEMKGTFLYGILTGLELFSIWNCVVIAIGLTAVSRLKKVYVYSAVGVVFIIGLLITAVQSAAMYAIM